MRMVGSGENLFPAGKVKGPLRRLDTPEQVLELLDEDGPPVVAWTKFAGSTFLSPVMDKVLAIVTSTGTSKGHLAIVARELGMPCVLAAQVDERASGQEILLDCTDEKIARIYLL
jgi:phosphoenolpyruvate-protein kinase (PTS system EI component)